MTRLIFAIAMLALPIMSFGEASDVEKTNGNRHMSQRELNEIHKRKVRSNLEKRRRDWANLTEDEKQNETERNMERFSGNFVKRLAFDVSMMARYPNCPKIKSIEVDYDKGKIRVLFFDGHEEFGKIRSREFIRVPQNELNK